MYGECAKTEEPIDVPFTMMSGMCPKNRVLEGRAHWRHLTNTVERLCAAAMSGSANRGGEISLAILL